ncbi:hypothetical protein BD770DRAFT_449709 [Pilaira anomala]|nr:hypothetical protein BD770DRAFT_449709 [Pilaira anomala]
MVRPSSKPSLVPDQASLTSSSRTRTRPQPHVPARTSFSQVQTLQVQVSSIEAPKVQTPTSGNFDFSYGDKRPFSVVSPSSSGDTSSKKSSAVSQHQLRDIKDRLKRLEDAYAEIFTLRNALEHSESARRALESQVVQLKAAQQGPPTKSSPPPPSAAKSSEAGATFASVAAKNAPKPKSKAKAKKPPAPSPRRAAATIGRLFGPKAGTPSEYHFVYYKQSIRRPLKQLRASLKNIGVNVSRILDIHLMNEKGRGALPAREYDPYHPESLKDPKFGTLSFELRALKAREIQNTRCLRSLSFVRRSARLSVARTKIF